MPTSPTGSLHTHESGCCWSWTYRARRALFFERLLRFKRDRDAWFLMRILFCFVLYGRWRRFLSFDGRRSYFTLLPQPIIGIPMKQPGIPMENKKTSCELGWGTPRRFDAVTWGRVKSPQVSIFFRPLVGVMTSLIIGSGAHLVGGETSQMFHFHTKTAQNLETWYNLTILFQVGCNRQVFFIYLVQLENGMFSSVDILFSNIYKVDIKWAPTIYTVNGIITSINGLING